MGIFDVLLGLDHTLLQKVSRLDTRFTECLLLGVKGQYSFKLFFCCSSGHAGSEVWVFWTVSLRVTVLLAAFTFEFKVHCLQIYRRQRISLLLLVFFANLVLAILATRSFLLCFTATPPHFSAKRRVVRAARPVEVCVFVVLFATVFANLKILYEQTTPFSQLYASLFQFFPFHVQTLSQLICFSQFRFKLQQAICFVVDISFKFVYFYNFLNNQDSLFETIP